eukprot:1269275-Alexandrium_andersonii.AAC.1
MFLPRTGRAPVTLQPRGRPWWAVAPLLQRPTRSGTWTGAADADATWQASLCLTARVARREAIIVPAMPH